MSSKVCLIYDGGAFSTVLGFTNFYPILFCLFRVPFSLSRATSFFSLILLISIFHRRKNKVFYLNLILFDPLAKNGKVDYLNPAKATKKVNRDFIINFKNTAKSCAIVEIVI